MTKQIWKSHSQNATQTFFLLVLFCCDYDVFSGKISLFCQNLSWNCLCAISFSVHINSNDDFSLLLLCNHFWLPPPLQTDHWSRHHTSNFPSGSVHTWFQMPNSHCLYVLTTTSDSNNAQPALRTLCASAPQDTCLDKVTDLHSETTTDETF